MLTNPYKRLSGFVSVAGVTKKTFVLSPSGVAKIGNTYGGLLIINSGINQVTGVYSIPRGDSGSIDVVLKAPGEGSYFSLILVDGEIIITNLHTAQIAFWVEMISL